jgi:hypothetical protein
MQSFAFSDPLTPTEQLFATEAVVTNNNEDDYSFAVQTSEPVFVTVDFPLLDTSGAFTFTFSNISTHREIADIAPSASPETYSFGALPVGPVRFGGVLWS